MLEGLHPALVDGVAEAWGWPVLAIRLTLPLVAVVFAIIVGRLLEALVTSVLPRVAQHTSTRLDDLAAKALRGPVRVTAALVGVAVALLLTPLPPEAHAWTRGALAIVLGVSLLVVAARFVGGLIEAYGERVSLVGPARRVTRRIAVLLAWVVGALLILDAQGVSITPLLTTLGIAGLAVALAFQDTLSNYFAGLYVQADRPLAPGHYVKLDEHGIEGYVVDVGWRTTKIRTLGNNMVVVPNARLANTIVTDYDLPEPRMSLLVNVPVAATADPGLVGEILVDEAKRAAKEVDGLLASPEPFVRFIPGFTEKGLELTLIVQVRTFVDQYLAQHELRHRIDARLRKEGIALGAPRRLVTTT